MNSLIMEKSLQTLPQIDDIYENISTMQNYQEVSTYMKQMAHFYREENACLEEILSDVTALNEHMKPAIGNYSSLGDIRNACENSQTKNLNNNALALSQSERLRKHNNYLSKLKTCIKLYMNLNEKLLKNLKVIKSELKLAKTKVEGIANINAQDIHELEEKARRYERDLIKFEKKYPWLKDDDLDLPNIAKEIDMLKNLQGTREKMVQELSFYGGLKPDLREAAQQLAEMKEEHRRFVLNKFE